jgi:hypothetical protein
MNLPGFTADASLYQTSGQYQALRLAPGRPSASLSDAVIPSIPACSNCDYILERCAMNGGRPRAVCNACATGYCYEEPPMPNPFPDPFPPLPRFP